MEGMKEADFFEKKFRTPPLAPCKTKDAKSALLIILAPTLSEYFSLTPLSWWCRAVAHLSRSVSYVETSEESFLRIGLNETTACIIISLFPLYQDIMFMFLTISAPA
jgi:hypothetical protein